MGPGHGLPLAAHPDVGPVRAGAFGAEGAEGARKEGAEKTNISFFSVVPHDGPPVAHWDFRAAQ